MISCLSNIRLEIKSLLENKERYLTMESLKIYSPKFAIMIETIQHPNNIGLNLIYSQFLTFEGIGLFTLALQVAGYAQFKIAKNENSPHYFQKESLFVENYGIHVFPYESTNDVDVLHRQSFSIESYIQNKIPQIKIFSFGKEDPKKENIEHFEIKDINHESYKCERDYYFLYDILEKGLTLTDKDDYLIYTNSDCHIGNKFYEFILSSNYDYFEFFRLETVEGIVVGQNKDGIDCFAIKNHVLKNLISNQILPFNLILGAPYWDAVFSSIARKHIQNKYQDTKRLFHTKHKPRWNLNDLDYAGVHNLSILNNLYNKGLINCRKSEIKSSTLVIRVFDKATDMLRARENIMS
jgi:hypothetical protein